MTELSDDELQLIEEYSSYFLNVREIAVLINRNPNFLSREINKQGSKAMYAYNRGKTLSKMEIRKNIIKMAKHGSPQAEILADKYILDQEMDDKNDD